MFGRERGGRIGIARGDGLINGAVLFDHLRRALGVGNGRLAVAAGLAVQRHERVADDSVAAHVADDVVKLVVHLAQVLGVAFLDADGKALAPGGGSLARLARIETDAIVPQAKDCTFILACDVRNQLCGTEGAAAVFGPQKGATPEQVALLDQALSRYASVLSSQLGSDAAQRDGAGAAGGIGCAMMAFFGASFLSGIDLVLDAAGFSTAVAGADLVLTGEGRLDAQSAYGKVPCGVARRAKAVRNVPVLAIGGALGDGAESLYSCGVDALASTVSRITTLESAMANAVASIEETTARTMRLLDAGRKMEQNKVS